MRPLRLARLLHIHRSTIQPSTSHPRKLNWGNRACALLLLCATTVIVSSAQTLTTLHSFDVTDGQVPSAALVQAPNGDLYGTTEQGGASFAGTVFKITPNGGLTSLHGFDSTDGSLPYGSLVQD